MSSRQLSANLVSPMRTVRFLRDRLASRPCHAEEGATFDADFDKEILRATECDMRLSSAAATVILLLCYQVPGPLDSFTRVPGPES